MGVGRCNLLSGAVIAAVYLRHDSAKESDSQSGGVLELYRRAGNLRTDGVFAALESVSEGRSVVDRQPV